jgi:hypothetical protein
MPHWYPKLLSSDVAQRYADLTVLIVPDLDQVSACCQELLKRGKDPSQNPLSGDAVVRALLDSAVIRYRRCFNKGVRTRLTELLEELSSEEQQLHQFFYDLGDKHIAHSVNGFEHANTMVYIDESTPGVVLRQPRGGIGAGGMFTLQLSLHTVQQFGLLVARLRELARKWAREAHDHLAAEVQAMSDDQLRALPCGAVGLPDRPPVHKARPNRPRGHPVG